MKKLIIPFALIVTLIVLAFLYRTEKATGIFIGFAIVTLLMTLSCLPRMISRANLKKLQTDAIDRESNVTVLSKTSEVSKEIGRAAEVNTFYYISFLFPDGLRKNFNVTIDVYNTILEDEKGRLTYKQNGDFFQFVDFQRQM